MLGTQATRQGLCSECSQPHSKERAGERQGDRRAPRLSPRPEQWAPRMALSSARGRPREASRGRGPQSWVLKNLEFRWKKIEKDISGSRTHLCRLLKGQVKRQGSTSRVTPCASPPAFHSLWGSVCVRARGQKGWQLCGSAVKSRVDSTLSPRVTLSEGRQLPQCGPVENWGLAPAASADSPALEADPLPWWNLWGTAPSQHCAAAPLPCP